MLARLLGIFVLPLALTAGIVLQLLWPGDFGFRLEDGGPEAATWFAAVGGCAALVAASSSGAARARPRRLARARRGGAVPPAGRRARIRSLEHERRSRPDALTPGLVQALRDDVPKRAVVFSDMQTSYRIAADAPVLIVAAPPEHVADTKQNGPYRRRQDVLAFFRTGDLAIPRGTVRGGSSSRAVPKSASRSARLQGHASCCTSSDA